MSAAGQQEENAGGEVTITEGPEATVTIPPPVADDDGDEGGAGRAAAEPARPNHKERKQNRLKEANDRAEAAERAARESSERLARLEREHAEVRGYLVGQQERQRGGDGQSELTARITRMRQDAQGHLERSAVASKAGDRATAERELASYHAQIEEATAAAIEARLVPQFEERLREVQSNIPSAEMMVTRDKLGQEFPWLYDDAEARAAVDAKINALTQSGRPQGYATYREAAAAVARRMGLGGRATPPAESRQRYQAVGAGEGSGGAEGPIQIKMGPAEKRLAHLSFSKLEAKEAEKAWAKDMAERKRKGDWSE